MMMNSEDHEFVENPRSFSWYWNQHLLWDFIFSIALFISVVVAGCICHWEKPLTDLISGNRAQLYSALISVYGSLLGFVITAAVFSAGLIEHKTFDRLLKQDSFYDIFRIYSQSAIALSLGFFVALISLVLDSDNLTARSHAPGVTFLVANLFTFVLISFRIAKAVWILHWLAAIHVAKTRHDQT